MGGRNIVQMGHISHGRARIHCRMCTMVAAAHSIDLPISSADPYEN